MLQNFGHYAKDCPTSGVPVCGKCSAEGHSTRDCQEETIKCINCLRKNCNEFGHTASSFKCPSLIKEQDVLRKRLENARLNMTRKVVQSPT